MSETFLAAAMFFLNAAPDADEAAFVGVEDGVSIYEFDDDDIEGEVLSPDGVNLGSRGAARHASLLHIRTNFIPELTRLSLDLEW